MPLEEEMRNEMYKLEKEISLIDEEIEKLSTKIINFINVRRKKEHDLKILRGTFAEIPTETEEIQLTLAKLLKEKV